MNYVCEKCGARLDPGEKCNCLEESQNEKESEEELTVEEVFTGRNKQKKEYRLEICICCGNVWNISIHSEMSEGGYVCPYCRSKTNR